MRVKGVRTLDKHGQQALAEIISSAVPVKEKHKHPATRSFQAIRIYINQELQAVEQGLKGAAAVLAKASMPTNATAAGPAR